MNYYETWSTFCQIEFSEQLEDRVLGTLDLWPRWDLGFLNLCLSNIRCCDAFQVSSWKRLLFQMLNRQNQIGNLQDAFSSFDKGGNGMVPTKVSLYLLKIKFSCQNLTTKLLFKTND